MPRPLSLSLFLIAGASIAAAQSQTNAGKLAFVLPFLYGPDGLTLANPNHLAHFDSAFQSNFLPFNAALGSQLTTLPIPSPASGFTYTFDKSAGVYTRSAQSFGPVLSERAETIGKDKFFFGFAYQRFRFDEIDGLDMHKIPVVFQHQPAANPLFVEDVITANNYLDVQLSQTSLFFTYGLGDRVDVSVAVPFVSASVSATSNATIQRIGTADDPTIHAFSGPNPNQATFLSSGTASGIGDILVRAKATAWKSGGSGVALGLDLRLPTGDEYNFLGSGAAGIKPFVAVSTRIGRMAPHANFSYEWNGDSVLAGDVVQGRKARLPSQLASSLGFDYGVNNKLTLAADLLGQRLNDASTVYSTSFTAFNGTLFPQIAFRQGAIYRADGSLGFKINAYNRLLVTFNTLFRLNERGLRSRVTPLLGLSWTL
jgi:hypothetical protein